MDIESREPNWAKWRNIERIEVWEGVALSMDIDPDKADKRIPWELQGDCVIFDESQEFKDRADIAERHFGGLRSTVKISDFVQFMPKEWELPEAFLWERQPTDSSSKDQPVSTEEQRSTDSPSEDKPLSTRERETLLIIIAALCELNKKSPNERGLATELAAITERLKVSRSDDRIREYLKKAAELIR